MSINQEHYPLTNTYHDFSGISPLYRANPSIHRFHSDPRRIRTPLRPNTALSSHTDPYSLEHFNLERFKSCLASSGANQASKRSVKLSDQLRTQQQKRKKVQNGLSLQEELVSPIGVEPESSSSQPSEPFSGSYRDQSPYKIQGDALQKAKNIDSMFCEALYVRANEFLDHEGLDVVDPQDCYYGKIHSFFKPKELKVNTEDNGKDVRSLTQSPRFLSNHISSSTLFQRRASRSQGPVGETSEDGAFAGRRPGKLSTFRHFNEDVNQILQASSPIEEKDTPVMSRNDSGYQGSTPNGRKLFGRGLLSPDTLENLGSEENSLVSSLTKYKLSNSKKFKSPLLEVKPMQNFLEGSPIINLKLEKEPSSLESSPAGQDPNAVKDAKNKTVVRKSRFQKPEGL